MDTEVVDRDTPDLRSTPERTIVDLQGDGPLVSLGRYRYLAAREPVPAQRHASLLVLAFPIRSDVGFNLDGRVIDVVPGQVIIIPPGTVYGIDGTQPRGELFWLVLRVRPAANAVDLAVRELTGDPGAIWAVPATVVDQLGRALADPDDLRWPRLAARHSLCATAVFEVLLARREGIAEPVREVPPGVRRALERVSDRVDEPISVHDLIESSGMSPTQFYDAFVAAAGTSPKDYILRAKIARAKDLLAEPEHTITEIGHRLGFSSSQHFAEVFRRYEGRSPSEFRREMWTR